MDLIEIVQDDPDIDNENEGSDIDAADIIEDFDNENVDENGDFVDENERPPDPVLDDDGAPLGPPAGGAPDMWRERITAVERTPFTGNISLFTYSHLFISSYTSFGLCTTCFFVIHFLCFPYISRICQKVSAIPCRDVTRLGVHFKVYAR
jgi:hypothetical protein